MPAFDDAGLDRDERVAIEVALASDHALAEELELITSQLAPDLRAIFWRAFAAGCRPGRRPAAIVLEALEQAALNAPR